MQRLALLSLVLLAPRLAACGDDKTVGDAPSPASVVLECTPDQCAIAGRCWDNLDANPSNPCQACLVTLARTQFSPWDAGLCDDGDACSDGDACADGACVGTPRVCDDDDPCTDDVCDRATGECRADPDFAKCGLDPCSADPAPDCDDDDPCTEDRCEAWVGCVHASREGGGQTAGPAGESDEPIGCDDGDACTSGDTCQDGVCRGAAVVVCDDGDVCTIDVCDATGAGGRGQPSGPSVGGCRHEAIASLCDDENPCTDERCDPSDGCVYPFNSDPCDDGDVCTANDTCRGGACLGAAVPIDDLNVCTDDACDRLAGVSHVPNRLPCDDGNACTVGDGCADALCVPGARPLVCDDQNGCSDDRCDPLLGCVFEHHARPCDDNSLCTSGDQCAAGACVGSQVDCDDGNACTADSCTAAVGCLNTLIVSNECRPTIVVSYPPRGATLTEPPEDTVTVTGTVSSGAGLISALTVNGVSTGVLRDGSFSRTITPRHGGNILVIEATDAFGSKRRTVQSFLWSRSYRHPTTPKNGMATQGVGVWLDAVAIDDGTRGSPPNDLASILQIALRTFDIASLIPRPAANNVDAGSLVGTYDIYVDNLTYDPPNAQLWPQPGGIHLRGVIADGRADFAAYKQCSAGLFSCWGPGTITGTMTFSSIVIDVDLDFAVVNHAIAVTVRSSTVVINGVDIQVDGAFGWLYEFILSFFEDDLVSRIENEFNAQLAPVIGPLVEDGLAALAFQMALDVPKVQGGGFVPVDVVTDWQDVDCSAAGCKIVLRAGAYTDVKRTPYGNSGVPDRDGCGNGTQTLVVPATKILELSLADDTLNQLLFALWRGGLLEFPVPAAWLQGVDLAQFGISGLSMQLSGMLAPTASSCAGSGLDAHVGDVKITAQLQLFGQPVDVIVWASVVAGVEMYLDGRSIGVRLTGIERLESEVTVLQSQLISLEPVVADLIAQEVVPGLIAALGGGELGNFPLPDIDLSGAIPGLPPGTGITIVPETLTRQSGNTIAGGRLD